MRTRLARTLLGIALVSSLAGGLVACSPGGSEDTVDREVSSALEGAHLGISDADASTSNSGSSTTLSVAAAIDGDRVDGELLRGILETTVDAIGSDSRVDVISVAVSQGSIDGDRLALDTAAADLGFAPQPSGSAIAFDETLASVKQTLGL